MPAVATDLSPHHAEAVRDAARPVLADNSRRTYAAVLRRFDAWARQHGYSIVPPVPDEIVSAWLLDIARSGRSVSTVAVGLAAVKWTHEQAGLPFARTVALANTIKRIRRDHATTPDQAAAIKAAMLADMLSAAPATIIGMRDAAMLALAYVFALRRSELVAIDLATSGTGNTLVIGADALMLTIRRSKTSQDAAQTLSVPRSANPRAVGAVDRWIREAPIEAGTPIMRSLTPYGAVTSARLTADMAARAIRGAVARYLVGTGMERGAAAAVAKAFSGHSGRVGFITSAVEGGASHEHIGKVSRHAAGSKMIGRYSEQADQLRTAPHHIKGVGV